MILEKEKSACIESMHTAITKTRDWRGRLAEQYPQDTRNKRAEVKLAKLADQTSSLTNQHWDVLKPFFNEQPTRWRDCLSQATRQIGFAHKTTSFPFFVRNVISFLQTEKV